LNLINSGKIAQRNYRAIPKQAHPCNVDRSERPALYQGNREPGMRVDDRTGGGRAIDTESQFVEGFMSKIPAVLKGEVMIGSLMKGGEAGDVSSRRCSEVGNRGRTVVNDVAAEQRMRVREVVIDTDHAVVFGCVSLVRSD